MAVETMHPPSRHFVAVCRSDGDINWMYTLMGGAMRTCSWSQKTLTCSATQRACSVVQQWQTDTSTGAAGADDVVLLVLLLLLLLLSLPLQATRNIAASKQQRNRVNIGMCGTLSSVIAGRYFYTIRNASAIRQVPCAFQFQGGFGHL